MIQKKKYTMAELAKTKGTKINTVDKSCLILHDSMALHNETTIICNVKANNQEKAVFNVTVENCAKPHVVATNL